MKFWNVKETFSSNGQLTRASVNFSAVPNFFVKSIIFGLFIIPTAEINVAKEFDRNASKEKNRRILPNLSCWLSLFFFFDFFTGDWSSGCNNNVAEKTNFWIVWFEWSLKTKTKWKTKNVLKRKTFTDWSIRESFPILRNVLSQSFDPFHQLLKIEDRINQRDVRCSKNRIEISNDFRLSSNFLK